MVKLCGEERRKLKGKAEDLKGSVEKPEYGREELKRRDAVHEQRGRAGEYC